MIASVGSIAPLVSLLVACGGASLIGARAATPAEREMPIEARYVCASPTTSFTIKGKTAHEFVPPPQYELRTGAKGPVLTTADQPTLVGGGLVYTNHWVASDGDHFFLLSRDQTLGAETIISPDRKTALDLLYMALGVGAVVETSEPDDGTIRPQGMPSSVNSCVREDDVGKLAYSDDRIKIEGQALARTNARPVAHDSVTSEIVTTLSMATACMLHGETAPSFGLGKQKLAEGKTWDWMPNVVYRGAGGRRYVEFDRSEGPHTLFAVEPDDKGALVFLLGELTFYFVNTTLTFRGKPGVLLVGEIAGRPSSIMTCFYQDP